MSYNNSTRFIRINFKFVNSLYISFVNYLVISIKLENAPKSVNSDKTTLKEIVFNF